MTDRDSNRSSASIPAQTDDAAGRFPLAALWASAFVLTALIITQAGRLGLGNAAFGEMAADGNEYALVTTSGGNQELLYVLEKRSGRIFVYEAGQNSGMRLLDYQDVGEWVTRLQQRTNTPGGGN